MNTFTAHSSVVEDIERWLAHLQHRGCKRRTVRTYRDALMNLNRALLLWGISRTAIIQPETLSIWAAQLTKSGCMPATCDLYIRAVQYWLAWLVEEGFLFSSAAEALPRPKQSRVFGRCPTEADIRRLLAHVAGHDAHSLRDRALLELAYATGARCEEIARLDLSSVILGSRSVILDGKGDKQRSVPLTTTAINALKVYLEKARSDLLCGQKDQPALFIGLPDGQRMATWAIARMVTRRGAEIGLKISPHDIRRAFATHLLNGGASIVHLKDFLGHAGYRHLRHYVKQTPKDMIATVRNSPLNQ